MPLTAGAQIGSYEIIALIGVGGMGEVYQARDLKLGRQVAIKVLRGESADDPERLARFQREARLLASLNHPNIATLYGLEEHGGLWFLVMELVPGQTLAQRLASGPLAPGEALALAQQIAQGLEVAHEQGIIHRDLKPANVKVTPEGKVKVLDFGLAKALVIHAHASQPTDSYHGTREGVILGTPAYMSPEQVRGAALDRRSDVWSFACVLFEMLTGRQAFAGETMADIVAAVLGREPDWSLLPQTTPGRIQEVLQLCLRKDPTRRPRDIGDLRLLLEDAAEVRQPGSMMPDRTVQQVRPTADPAWNVTSSKVEGPFEGRDLEQMRKAVLVLRLKQLLWLLRAPVSVGPGCLIVLTLVALCYLFGGTGALLSRLVEKDPAFPPYRTHSHLGLAIIWIPTVIVGLLVTFFVMRNMIRWARKRREQAIAKTIDLIEKEYPSESQRWGGAAFFTDPIRVRAMLSILERGR
jgi:tRNA A-37 threonylcarbamoyl transferase component Bud32